MVIKEKEVPDQGELQSITTTVVSPKIIKDLRVNATTVERRATWRKIVWSNNRPAESNIATNSNLKEKSEDDCDAEASLAIEEDKLALTIMTHEWIEYK
ncbi:unnamed protein product [Prunus armeniaca]|uniref:Uncharacterized protein n=1 Tax=Prunus armeniaca TaxID=36596 RepID=A0A6J5XZW7_PRUAR|nr:unnamed protein product [Prunus armeniaca]